LFKEEAASARFGDRKGKKMLVDPNAPFFRAAWVRVLCVVLPFLWAGMELWHGNAFWAILFGAAGIYLGLALFVWRKPEK
jgi:hypothetical protein